MVGRAPPALRQCIHQSRCSTHPRAFSSSSRRLRHGPLTAFPPSSSPELDGLLATIRNTVFLPNHLRTIHRELVYKTKLHHFLEGDEPVEVPVRTVDAIDGSKIVEEKFRLHPMDHFDAMPAKAMIRKLVPLLQTKEDWAMVSSFLREFKMSGRALTQGHISKIVRAAASKGQSGVVLEMFKRCKETDMFLRSMKTCIEVMLCCLHRAYANRWAEADVEKASRHANSAMWMMIQRAHAPNGVAASPASRPEVIGAALALACAKSKSKNYEDEDQKVAKYTAAFLQAWPKGSEEIKSKIETDANEFLVQWLPAWLGVQLAQRVSKDVEALQQLEDIADKLKNDVMQALDSVQNLPQPEKRRGMVLHTELARALD